MNRRRLEHTARQVLPYLLDEEFRMDLWACQTAACAFGSEALSKYGRRNGLKPLRGNGLPGAGCVMYAGHAGCTAAALYYDIAHEDASAIFGIHDYDEYPITPAMVASRIESLLASESP